MIGFIIYLYFSSDWMPVDHFLLEYNSSHDPEVGYSTDDNYSLKMKFLHTFPYIFRKRF